MGHNIESHLPEVLQRALTDRRSDCERGDVPGEERDVGLEEGQDEGAQREVGHLLQHVVEVTHRDGASLDKVGQITQREGLPHYSLGRQLVPMVCYMFSENSPCLLGQHGSCSTAQWPGELSENMMQKPSE